MRAIVLAAGEGSRLRPLTGGKPKPMLQVANKPVSQYVVEALAANGVRDLTMVVGYHREKVQSHYADGKRFGVNVRYVFQDAYLGTAHALSRVEFEKEEVLVLAGDNIVDARLVRDLLEARAKHPDEILLVAKSSDNPTKYGVLTLDGDLVRRIEEKPPFYTSEFVNTGVYAFPAGFHAELLARVRESVFGLSFLLDDLIKSGRRVRAVKTRGQWIDAVYPWDVLTLTGSLLADERVDVRVSPNSFVHESAVLQAPVVVGEGSSIGPLSVVAGSTTIGDNVHIGPHCVIENCIIGDDVQVGPHAILRNAVIADGTRIGPRLSALSGACDVRVRDGYHELSDFGCVIGEDAVLGGNVVIEPGTLVGNRARVANGATLRGLIDDDGKVI